MKKQTLDNLWNNMFKDSNQRQYKMKLRKCPYCKKMIRPRMIKTGEESGEISCPTCGYIFYEN